MVAQANDADDYYAQIAREYSEETGVEIEVIPYPSDAYNTQVTTQLQAGNAADMMILSPGTGQPISVVTLADAGFLEPLDETSAGLIPEGSEAEYQIDGETFAPADRADPRRHGLQRHRRPTRSASTSTPRPTKTCSTACATARDGGKTFTVLAGGIPFNTGLFSMLDLGDPRLRGDPDWNEQRAAGDVTFADSGWRDVLEDIVEMNDCGLLPGRRRGRHVRLDHPGPRRRHVADRGRARQRGRLDRQRRRARNSTFRRSRRPTARTRSRCTGANYAWAHQRLVGRRRSRRRRRPSSTGSPSPSNAKEYADLSGSVPITGIDAGRRCCAVVRADRRAARERRLTSACRTPRGRTRPCTTRSAPACRAC